MRRRLAFFPSCKHSSNAALTHSAKHFVFCLPLGHNTEPDVRKLSSVCYATSALRGLSAATTAARVHAS